MTKLNPNIRNVLSSHISDENLEKLFDRIKNDLGLEVVKERIMDGLFGEEKEQKNYSKLFLLSGGASNWYVDPKDKRTKKWRELRKELSFLRRYIYTLGNLPTENFLNSYENYEVGENSEAVEASQRFLKSDTNPRLLWIHGKPGVGKSHLFSAMIERVVRQEVEWEFDQLDDDKLLLCSPYLDFGNKMQCSDFSIKKFGGQMYFPKGSIRVLHGRSKYKENIFKPKEGYTLFLDDLPEKEDVNSKVMKYIQEMHNDGIGSAVITSNYSMSDWITLNAHLMNGSSPQGLESRLRQFGREFEIVGDTRRTGADW